MNAAVVAACVIGAIAGMLMGVPGWGWLLLVAVLLS
jgi:hypothetical protein